MYLRIRLMKKILGIAMVICLYSIHSVGAERAFESVNDAVLESPLNIFDYPARLATSAVRDIQEGYDARALMDINRAIMRDPYAYFLYRTENFYNIRGIIYYGMKDYATALENFNAAIAVNPTFSAAYFNRGIVYKTLGRQEDAIVNLRKALSTPKKYGEIIAEENGRGIKDYEYTNKREAIKKKLAELGETL